MFLRKMLAIGGNEFFPYFSTTVKLYIEILSGMLVKCCHCHDCPGLDVILLV